jgi:phage terminase large subunit-like protein
MFGLRLGPDPRAVVMTTPKPIKTLKNIIKLKTTEVTKGTTYDNIDNLAPIFIDQIVKPYEGTRLGRQELRAEILDDNPDALWNRQQIEDLRVTDYPQLIRIVIAVDPQATNEETSSETGIVGAGIGVDGQYYVLDDATVKASPHGWGTAAVATYNKRRADRIIGEVNNGGDMVEHTIRTVDKKVAYKKVHATRGKQIRAEPISALYEQGKVHHVGAFPQLEDQLCEWVPGDKSPDRLDALVWALTELSENNRVYNVSLAANNALARPSENML